MNSCRGYVSVALLNGQTYAMDGFNSSISERSTERCSLETNKWAATAPMNIARSNASCTALHNKVEIIWDNIYTICKSYNPEADQWTSISPMSKKHIGLGVIANASQIFAVSA